MTSRVDVRRRARIVAILDHCRDAGVRPVHGSDLHVMAYMCDVLAPIWDLPTLDSRLLKTKSAPRFPALQRDIDRLVGAGVLSVGSAGKVRSGAIDRGTTTYELTPLATPVIEKLAAPEFEEEQRFIHEVVLALSGIEASSIQGLGLADLSYADPLVDADGLLELDGEAPTVAAATARRFRVVAPENIHLSDAQLVHLYVQHLYRSMRATG